MDRDKYMEIWKQIDKAENLTEIKMALRALLSEINDLNSKVRYLNKFNGIKEDGE